MTDPSDGLDGLIERINALADCSYWANAGWDIPGDATQVIGRLAVQAAAALVQLRDENARLTQHRYTDAWREATDRAERAEAEVARLMLLLRNAMNWIYEAGTASGYGFYRTKNPHDFSPDPESCTADEFANHKAACDLWDRGEYDSSKEKGSEWLRSEDGKLVAHILRAPWGIGSYSETVPQVQALIDAIKAAKDRP